MTITQFVIRIGRVIYLTLRVKIQRDKYFFVLCPQYQSYDGYHVKF